MLHCEFRETRPHTGAVLERNVLRYVVMDFAEGKPGAVYYPISLREAPFLR